MKGRQFVYETSIQAARSKHLLSKGIISIFELVAACRGPRRIFNMNIQSRADIIYLNVNTKTKKVTSYEKNQCFKCDLLCIP